MNIRIKVGRFFDGTTVHSDEARYIVVRGGRITEISRVGEVPGTGERFTEIDATGLTVLPGLIDAHFHSVSSTFDVASIDRTHPSLRALDARRHLESALLRGFTTVRDAGGGDIGLVRATEQGLIRGPRLFISGKALSQTGGHGDMRAADSVALCNCGYNGALSAVVDGPDQVRAAVREQLRQGAHQIKLFVSGGVLSPTDPIWMNQFTDQEIRAAVEEAATRRTYVMAHAHTAEAARRCARNGVRSIEHGTLMDRASADEVAQAGAFVVPTLGVVDALRKNAASLPAGAGDKLRLVADENMKSLDVCASAGVKLGFGTDLFGSLREQQSREFTVRGQVQSNTEVIASATHINAELLNMSGDLGALTPGAFGDLIGVSGDPFADLQVLATPETHLKLIVRGGEIVLNLLTEHGK
ncbi:MAG TPA: amidohydrolase family protein [Steroidobacteraceae bacterium]|nr:amidohydrolase family protein [Steroidobacteraceae bacterium]